MAGSLPGRRVHEDGGVKPHNVLMQLYHTFPPVIPDVLFEFCTVLAIIVHGAQAIIDLAAAKDIAIFLCV